MDIFVKTLNQKKIIAQNSLAVCLYNKCYNIYYRIDGCIKNVKFQLTLEENKIKLIGINIHIDNHVLNYDNLEFLEIIEKKDEFIYLKSLTGEKYICTEYTTPQIILNKDNINCMIAFIRFTKNYNISISKYVNTLEDKKIINVSAKTIQTGNYNDIVYVHYILNNKLVKVIVPIFNGKIAYKLFGQILFYKFGDKEYIYDNNEGELRDIIIVQKPKYIVTRFNKSNIYMKNCKNQDNKIIDSDKKKYRLSSLWKIHYPNGEVFAFTHYNMPIDVVKFISCYDDFILVFFEKTDENDKAFKIVI